MDSLISVLANEATKGMKKTTHFTGHPPAGLLKHSTQVKLQCSALQTFPCKYYVKQRLCEHLAKDPFAAEMGTGIRGSWTDADLLLHHGGLALPSLPYRLVAGSLERCSPSEAKVELSWWVLLPAAFLPDLAHVPDVGDGLRGAWGKPSNIFCSLHPLGMEHKHMEQLHLEKIILSVWSLKQQKDQFHCGHMAHVHVLHWELIQLANDV